MARSMLGGTPQRAVLAFDPAGSYAVTYAAQGADRGFAMGLMGKPLTDESFFTALGDAPSAGMDLDIEVRPLAKADHPNTVELDLTSADGTELQLVARSIGGGEVEITARGRPPGAVQRLGLRDAGGSLRRQSRLPLAAVDRRWPGLGGPSQSLAENGLVRLTARRKTALPATFRDELLALDGGARVWESTPVYFVQTGRPLFSSAAEMVRIAEQRGFSLGRLALAYEAQLLGMSEAEVMAEMLRRYDIMVRSVERGLDPNFTGLQLLPACAGAIFKAEAEGRLSVRSLHTRAAARAMAVMHVDGAMGVVCAAPTGGSAGVIPGTLVTLAEERSLTREQIALALLAAGAIGMILAIRGTFAAEVAGCQVEIGASGAMAAAAVVDAVGGTARQACDAAAICFPEHDGHRLRPAARHGRDSLPHPQRRRRRQRLRQCRPRARRLHELHPAG